MTATVTELKPPVKKRPQPLKRGSAYFLPESDHPLVSVTTVLKEVAKQEALTRWAAKLAASYAFANPESSMEEATSEPFRTRDSAGAKGKTIHSWVEAYANGADMDPDRLPTEMQGYARAFLSWAAAVKPKFLHNEIAVFNLEHEYAGTADSVIEDHAGNTLLLDWKTSKSLYEWEYGLQASAYLHADFILDGPTRKEIPVPPIDATAVVHLKADGSFGYHQLPDHFHSFLAYLHIFRAKRGEPCVDACWCKGMTE